MTQTVVLPPGLAAPERPDFWTGLLLSAARSLGAGSLLVTLPGGGQRRFQGTRPGPSASLVLTRGRAARRLLLGGSVGFAEAYLDGDWDSPDLTALIRLAIVNESAVDLDRRASPLLKALDRLRHRLNANTRRGSRRNIAFHYDLGNDFYGRWLDGGMTYSSGLFVTGQESLEQSQDEKYTRLLNLMRLQGGERVLEIGCGWGGMAEALADRGCRVEGITLSQAQLDYARARLGSRAELRFQDYRDVTGQYDRIVSVEMIEAVGEENWPHYFRQLHDRLNPGGLAVLQAITIAEDRFEGYSRGADFIQRHVFPGGMLPTPSIIRRQAEAAGLVVDHQECFGCSYALTLEHWRRRFHEAWPALAAGGMPQRFRRLWDYYLSYCEAGFREGTIDVGFYRLRKP